jgi:hypothetical protein
MRFGLCLTLMFVCGVLAWHGRAQTTTPGQDGKAVVLEVDAPAVAPCRPPLTGRQTRCVSHRTDCGNIVVPRPV